MPGTPLQRHPKQMLELAPLDAEEQWLYSKVLSGDWAPHSVPLGAPNHPKEETHFGRLYLRSLGYYPMQMTIGECRNIENQQCFALTDWYCKCITADTAPICLSISCSLRISPPTPTTFFGRTKPNQTKQLSWFSKSRKWDTPYRHTASMLLNKHTVHSLGLSLFSHPKSFWLAGKHRCGVHCSAEEWKEWQGLQSLKKKDRISQLLLENINNM